MIVAEPSEVSARDLARRRGPRPRGRWRARRRRGVPSGENLANIRRGFGRVAAELLELAAGDVEHPVVAARVPAPDLLRVGEDEQPLAVLRPGVVVDRERLAARARARARRRTRGPGARRSPCRSGRCPSPSGVGGGRLDRRVGLAAVDPARGPELLRLELLLARRCARAARRADRRASWSAARASRRRRAERCRSRRRAIVHRDPPRSGASPASDELLCLQLRRAGGSSRRTPPCRPRPAASRSSRWARGSRARAATGRGRRRAPSGPSPSRGPRRSSRPRGRRRAPCRRRTSSRRGSRRRTGPSSCPGRPAARARPRPSTSGLLLLHEVLDELDDLLRVHVGHEAARHDRRGLGRDDRLDARVPGSRRRCRGPRRSASSRCASSPRARR